MRAKLSVIVTASLAFLVGLFCFAGSALAAGAVDPTDASWSDLARSVFDQVSAGHYLAAVCLALVVAVAALKRLSGTGKVGTFVHGDVGGVLTTFGAALFGALATATVGGAAWHWSMLYAAGGFAVAAAGGYTIIKKLVIVPLTSSAWYANKAPAWFKLAMSGVLWIFDKPDAIATAQAAGQAAVDAKPSQGISDALGKPTEIK